MQTDFVKQWADIGNKTVSSLKDLGEINTKAAQKLTQQQLDFIDCCLETGVKQITLVTDSKGYKELLSGQANLASEFNEALMETLRKNSDILTESKDEFTAWLEKGYEAFATPVWKAPSPIKASSSKAV